jgi:periplasmic protein TonB
LDQAVLPFITAKRPWPPSPRRPGRLGKVLVISLWLHLTALLLLIVSVRYEQVEEELPPPATVAMVFEGGRPEGPALPNPQVPGPTPPAPEPQAAPPPSPPAAAPEPQPQPQPQPEAAIPLPPPVPPSPAPTLPLPEPPPPPLAMVVPRPPPEPRPAPAPTAKPPAFPAPMNFSFSRPIAPTPPTARTAPHGGPATLDFSLAPRQGATDTTPFSRVAGAHVGPDWRNLLSAWVKAHAYYPEQAAVNGEDGNATVEVIANPDGRVTSVRLLEKSGSTWLDLALQALFRDAHLPPLRDENEPITFNFTMHYILIRVQ